MEQQAMSSTEANPIDRTVASTQSEMTEIILPNDANTLGNLLGGRLMHFIDLTGAMAAYRHTRTHVVTAAMDHIDFIQPFMSAICSFSSPASIAHSIPRSKSVSRCGSRHPQTGTLLHVASAYLVFVAIDKHGKRQKVPGLQPETPDEMRRYEDALRRREHREAEAKRRKQAKVATSGKVDGAARKL